jgi:transcriptional accessory protein Tex/SPT6
MTDKKIEKPEEAVQVGQDVQVTILRVDAEARKIGLSMRSGAAAGEAPAAPQAAAPAEAPAQPAEPEAPKAPEAPNAPEAPQAPETPADETETKPAP